MQRFASLCLVLLMISLIAACAARQQRPYPVEQPQQAEPSQEVATPGKVEVTSCWPRLTLVGAHPTKVSMVRDEFVGQGWDPGQIKTESGGSRSEVRAEVNGGYVYIPTSNAVLTRGLCAVQKAAIQGMISYHKCK
jgi:hypothetical protein